MASDSQIRDTLTSRLGSRVLFDEPLASYLAYGVGGPADYLVFPRDEDELLWISAFAKDTGLPQTLVGTGTNLLVLDGGIRGIVLSLKRAFQEIRLHEKPHDGEILVSCGGGVQKPTLLEWAIDRGFTGLEFSAGVPGTIGGGIFMNAGTKYGSYGDILRSLRLFDFAHGVRQFQRDEVHFGYREQNAVRNSVVTTVVFALGRGEKAKISTEVKRIIAERAEKQPLDFPSCGSTFKNPPEGLSAGRLIERAGLKGTRVGRAEISDKHANFILNKGGATAHEILSLVEIVKARVKAALGVELECEVIILGSPSPAPKNR